MYVIRMMEHAVDQCEIPCTKAGNVLYTENQKAQCDDSPVRAWDQAVALYAGSLEGESGVGEGVLFFDLADTMCARFLACGDKAELRFGVSYTNNVVINKFLKGQHHLLQRRCGEARKLKDQIEKLMAIPLVQATILNTYQQVYEVAEQVEDRDPSVRAVEGSLYAATILPLVHDCNPADAQLIFDNLEFESGGNGTNIPDFLEVKEALERNYQCMGITCKAVGGIWMGREYYPDASPCQDELRTSGDRMVTIGIWIAIGGSILIGCTLLYLLYRRCRGIDYEFELREPSNDDSSSDNNNLHASRAHMD